MSKSIVLDKKKQSQRDRVSKHDMSCQNVEYELSRRVAQLPISHAVYEAINCLVNTILNDTLPEYGEVI